MGRADTDREFRRQEQMLARGASRLLQPKKAASIAHWHRDCEATKLAVALKKVVVLLLGKGARVDVQDKDGATALMWASANGHEEVVKLLLGEDVTIHLSAHEHEHFDALMVAARGWASPTTPARRRARRSTGDIDNNNKGYSALMWASEYGHKEVAELLLGKRAQVDLRRPKNGSRTPMIMASRKGHKEVVEMLLNRGASLEVELDLCSHGAKSALAAAEPGTATRRWRRCCSIGARRSA